MCEKVGASGKNDEEMENLDVEKSWWKIFCCEIFTPDFYLKLPL